MKNPMVSSSGIFTLVAPKGSHLEVSEGCNDLVMGSTGATQPDAQFQVNVNNEGGTYPETMKVISDGSAAVGGVFTMTHAVGGVSFVSDIAHLAVRPLLPIPHATFITSAASPYTVSTIPLGGTTGLETYYLMVDTTGGAVSVTIPTGTAGTPLGVSNLVVKDMGGVAGTNPITIQPAAGTIDGAATITISSNRGVVELAETGAGTWGVISANGASVVPIVVGTVDIPTGDALEFNTNNWIVQADGTDAVVQAASTGSLVFQDDQQLYFGTGKDGYARFTSGTNSVSVVTSNTTDGTNTSAVTITTGNSTAGAGNSGSVAITTGSSAGGIRGTVALDAVGFHPQGIYTNGTMPSSSATVHTQGMVTLAFDLPNQGAPGVTNYAFPLLANRGMLITDVWAIKLTTLGGAGDQVQVLNNGSLAISDVMSLNVGVNTVVRASQITVANCNIAGTENIRIAHTDAGGGSDSSVRVVIAGMAVT